MKSPRVLLFSLCLGATASLPGQTVTDPLTTATAANWNITTPASGNASLTFGASSLGFATGPATANDTAALVRVTSGAPSIANWTVQVDLHLTASGSVLTTNGQFANLKLIVAKATDGANFNTTFALDRYNAGGPVVQDIEAYMTTGGVGGALATPQFVATSATTLLISYDAGAQTLSYAYDFDTVGVNGASFTAIPAYTQDISSWNMLGGNFGFLLVGSAGSTVLVGPVLTAPDAYFSNFAVNVTAVPEPATYAALLGLAALGLTSYRRRHPRSG